MAQEHSGIGAIPFIDGRVEHISASKVRLLTRGALRTLDHPIIVHGDDATPRAVIIPYGLYMVVQSKMLQALAPMLDRMPGVDPQPGENE